MTKDREEKFKGEKWKEYAEMNKYELLEQCIKKIVLSTGFVGIYINEIHSI